MKQLSASEVALIAGLYAEEGIDASIRQIASAVGLTHTKLLRIFNSKLALRKYVCIRLYTDTIAYIFSHWIKNIETKQGDQTIFDYVIKEDPFSKSTVEDIYKNCITFSRLNHSVSILMQFMGRPNLRPELIESLSYSIVYTLKRFQAKYAVFMTAPEQTSFAKDLAPNSVNSVNTQVFMNTIFGVMMSAQFDVLMRNIFSTECRGVGFPEANQDLQSSELLKDMLATLIADKPEFVRD